MNAVDHSTQVKRSGQRGGAANMVSAGSVAPLLATLLLFYVLLADDARRAALAQAVAVAKDPATAAGEPLFEEYCRLQAIALRDACLQDIRSLEDWESQRMVYRRQLLSMLGLDPLPERSDLRATITASDDYTVESESLEGRARQGRAVRVERVLFQSRPGLYVTGNLYLPLEDAAPASAGQGGAAGEKSNASAAAAKRPAILYLCGHGAVKKNGVSYGNKVHYHHHGLWYARHGYVCLVLDSLQLGEIEGIHHGTHRHGLWWWLARGYTPAGVEAWNCLRALDYLESRPEVDAGRLGVTGRSGGGAYSWWIAAIDQRVQVAVPVAGITDLENHVIDGCVDGHCDCMFCVNTYRWDYPLVAALVAPRPLLISNTDRDPIFPLEGVVRTHAKVRRIYELYGKPENLALHITAGPHEDTQELQIHAFRWFNQHLKQDLEPVEVAARARFQPEQLQVFANQSPPGDARNARIDEEFVPRGMVEPPADRPAWERLRDSWFAVLEDQVFRGWPRDPEPLDVAETEWRQTPSIVAGAASFQSERPFRLPLVLLGTPDLPRDAGVDLRVVDGRGWSRWGQPIADWLGQKAELNAVGQLSEAEAVADDDPALEALLAHVRTTGRWLVVMPPRGIGPTAIDDLHATRLHRRLYLLGQTLDGLRTWDARRGIQTLRQWQRTQGKPLQVHGEAGVAGAVLYASLYEPDLLRVELEGLPVSHQPPLAARSLPVGTLAASTPVAGRGELAADSPPGSLVFLNVMRYLDVPHVVAMAAERGPVSIRATDPSDPAWNAARQLLRAAQVPADRLSIE